MRLILLFSFFLCNCETMKYLTNRNEPLIKSKQNKANDMVQNCVNDGYSYNECLNEYYRVQYQNNQNARQNAEVLRSVGEGISNTFQKAYPTGTHCTSYQVGNSVNTDCH